VRHNLAFSIFAIGVGLALIMQWMQPPMRQCDLSHYRAGMTVKLPTVRA
jgi:hypothetical protein